MTQRDEKFMAEAIRLGANHSGITGGNPSVGAVLVQDSGGEAQSVGCGATAARGRPHAETEALRQAGAQAAGATLYVTLEPCCHFGKTPPCTEALIKAGIKRAVIAVADPDTRVSGAGLTALRHAGIEVETGCLAEQAAQYLAPYLCRRKFARPFISAKLAVSADGFIGRSGEGQIAISGYEARFAAHQLRAAHDAVLVGIGTALADNPRLDCRLLGESEAELMAAMRAPRLKNAVWPRGAASGVFPLSVRIIMDTYLQLPPESRLAQSARAQPVWILCGQGADRAKQQALEECGCRIIRGAETEGRLDLRAALALFSQAGIGSIFAEGGTKLLQNFWHENLIDQLILFKSAKNIGGEGYKMPDFRGKTGYEKSAAQDIGADKAEIWLHLHGETGLLGLNKNKRAG